MKTQETYSEILRQAVAEKLRSAGAATLPSSDLAHEFGDALYRLCIEFGVEWNSLRTALLADLCGTNETAAGTHPLTGGLGDDVAVVLLALELMPEDPAI